MDICLDYLVIEGTRRYNMKCPHCQVGNAQRVDMDTKAADSALGDILLDCDMSYQTQKKHILGNIFKEPIKDILIRNLSDAQTEIVYG